MLKLIAEAYTSDRIAQELSISRRTVDRHRENILAKLGHARPRRADPLRDPARPDRSLRHGEVTPAGLGSDPPLALAAVLAEHRAGGPLDAFVRRPYALSQRGGVGWMREQAAPLASASASSASSCPPPGPRAGRRADCEWLIEMHCPAARTPPAPRATPPAATWSQTFGCSACSPRLVVADGEPAGRALMAFAVGIFAVALAAIASERVHRTKVALVGAGLMVVTQTIDQDEAIAAIDFNTIGLLAGMMVMVRLTETDRRLHLAGDPRRPALARPPARGGRLARRDDRACCRPSSTTSPPSC